MLAAEPRDGRDDASTLRSIAEELEADGVEAEQLRELGEQIEILERPPGLLQRVTSKARNFAARQWANFLGELEESREAATLISIRVRGERELTDEERAKIREQLMDLVRMFPVGVIAGLNLTFPFPGSSVFTPWLLLKLGLLPSRWREAHLLDQLRRHQRVLHETGYAQQAERIGEILEQLERDADQRASIGREGRLLTHWDENKNGVWDDHELAAYEREVEKIRALAQAHAASKRWFIEHEGEVFGAFRLTEIDEPAAAKSLLVCFDGQTGWVALERVLLYGP
jgi:hypothetical protein